MSIEFSFLFFPSNIHKPDGLQKCVEVEFKTGYFKATGTSIY